MREKKERESKREREKGRLYSPYEFTIQETKKIYRQEIQIYYLNTEETVLTWSLLKKPHPLIFNFQN